MGEQDLQHRPVFLPDLYIHTTKDGKTGTITTTTTSSRDSTRNSYYNPALTLLLRRSSTNHAGGAGWKTSSQTMFGVVSEEFPSLDDGPWSSAADAVEAVATMFTISAAASTVAPPTLLDLRSSRSSSRISLSKRDML